MIAKPSRVGSLCLIFGLLAAGTFWIIQESAPLEPIVALAADGEQKWFKGNLHTHSHWSDGNDYLESIAKWYRDREYDFLAFTDHNVLARSERWIDVEKSKGGREAYDKLKANFPEPGWVEERQSPEGRLEVRLRTFPEVFDKMAIPNKFLLIQGEEISDRFGNSPIHMNVSNVETAIPPLGGKSVTDAMQNNVNAVIAQRERTGRPMLIHLNHPNFHYGITAEDIYPVIGENFFEVYNGHPHVHNSGDHVHASTEVIWDIVNTLRLTQTNLPLMYGLGTDDGHEYHNIPSTGSNPGRGWVMVLARELTPEALITALEQGHFYASSGVELTEVRHDAQGITVTPKVIDGVTYQFDFIGTQKGIDPKGEPVLDEQGHPLPVTKKYPKGVGATFKTMKGASGSYEFTGDELYVRCRITSSRRHPNPSEHNEYERAWTQPVRPGL